MTIRRLGSFLKSLLPFKCRICHQLSSAPEGICEACIEQLPYRTAACPGCGFCWSALPVCPHCLSEGRNFKHFYSPFYYQAGIAALLRDWKYRYHRGAGQVVCTLMTRACGEAIDWEIDCILPVPPDPHRFRQRGFCTAQILAEQLADRICASVYTEVMQCKRATKSQTTKNRSGRLADRIQTFLCKDPAFLVGKHVLLVDDVMTTGATLTALKTICLEAGCSAVSAITLCVVPS